MKKKWLLIAVAVVLLSALATAAFADKPIELVVNGWIVETDVAPQLINDRRNVPNGNAANSIAVRLKSNLQFSPSRCWCCCISGM
ncbi:MAG: hypothetical protein GX425_10355 [Peptococcaceae bacterium]|nr:hypothetical protein [Peptococcaceae bacterium]